MHTELLGLLAKCIGGQAFTYHPLAGAHRKLKEMGMAVKGIRRGRSSNAPTVMLFSGRVMN